MMNTAFQHSLLFSISVSKIKNLQILNSKLQCFMKVVPLSQMTTKWPDINMIYLLSILKRPSKWGVILFVYNLSHWNPIFPLQENQILNNSTWKIKKAFSFLFFSVSYVEPEGNEKMRKILPIWSLPSFF